MIPASLKHEFSNGLVFQGVPVVPTRCYALESPSSGGREPRLSRVRLSELRLLNYELKWDCLSSNRGGEALGCARVGREAGVVRSLLV